MKNLRKVITAITLIPIISTEYGVSTSDKGEFIYDPLKLRRDSDGSAKFASKEDRRNYGKISTEEH